MLYRANGIKKCKRKQKRSFKHVEKVFLYY
ncbi:MAG: hypothetical protein H0W88_10050 [Parachlamydiaceae bacterium]|nr:hypothetical protein [Parachlamydiaceae bacterium]